jgi:hypothetical protein
MQNQQTMRNIHLSLILVCGSLVLSGCDNSAKKTSGDGAAESGAATATATATRCQNLLNNGMSRMDPGTLGIKSKATSAALGLNDWFKRCGNEEWSDTWIEDAGAILPAEIANRASSERFSDSDSMYIRTCLLLRAYAQAIEARSETERIVELFYAVMRDVSLVETDLPLTPFEVIMTGRGSAKDRAWVFISALRQLRIDGVILSSSSKESAWLVGALTDKKVLLFDMNLGLPIVRPGDPDGVLPSTPVTLSDLAGDDEILGTVTGGDHPSPMVDDDFKDCRALLVGGPSVFAQRSLLLQDVMTGDGVAVLCDPLHDIGESPGLVSRAKACADWSDQNLAIWDYPATQLDSFSRLNEEDLARLSQLMNPFKARVERNRVEDQLVFSKPHWELFEARVNQLSGTVSDNVPTRLQMIRLGKLEAVSEITTDKGQKVTVRSPEEFVVMHNRAVEDASLWVSVHQYRTEGYAAAIDGLYAYRRAYPDGIWKGHTEYILALSLAESGSMTKAIEYLDKAAAAGTPQTAGYQLLKQMWIAQNPDAAPKVKEPMQEAPKETAKEAPPEDPKENEEEPKQEEAAKEQTADGAKENSEESAKPEEEKKSGEKKKEEATGGDAGEKKKAAEPAK